MNWQDNSSIAMPLLSGHLMHAACEDALIAASLVQDFSCISSTDELVCIAQGLGNRECRFHSICHATMSQPYSLVRDCCVPVPSTLKDGDSDNTHTQCICRQFDCSNRCSLMFYIDLIDMLSKELLQDEL